MEKVLLFKLLLEIAKLILRDRDGDGRPDIFDSEPDNPGVK